MCQVGGTLALENSPETHMDLGLWHGWMCRGSYWAQRESCIKPVSAILAAELGAV